jgi:hypothetical protein
MAVASRRMSSRAGSSGSSIWPDQETYGGLAQGDLEVGIEVDMAAGVPEEASTQRGDLVGELIDAALVGLACVGGASGYGAVGAFELPGELDGSGDEEAFDVIAGVEVGAPGFQSGVEGVGVLAGEDGGLGAHAVLEGVHSCTLAATLGLRSRRVK